MLTEEQINDCRLNKSMSAKVRKALCDMALAHLAACEQEPHPTLAECTRAGMGPPHTVPYSDGGLPKTPEERTRFEAYMAGHCWFAGPYNEEKNDYETVITRMLYGVWRDRGALNARPVPEQIREEK